MEQNATNVLGSLHGGFTATLVDATSTYALYCDQDEITPSVSLDMHMTYMKAANLGDEILIDAKTMRAGKNLAYLRVEVKNKQTGDLLAQALHTRFLLSEKSY